MRPKFKNLKLFSKVIESSGLQPAGFAEATTLSKSMISQYCAKGYRARVLDNGRSIAIRNPDRPDDERTYPVKPGVFV